jgi:hypothetical protein
MDLINLTRLERNGKAEASPLDMLVDIRDINRPISENIDGNAVMYVEESIVSNRQAEGINAVQYIVDQDLATINTLSTDIFVATVETREKREPVAGMTTLGFVSNRIVGGIFASGTGSKFMYMEDDGSHPVEYVVTEDIPTLKLML